MRRQLTCVPKKRIDWWIMLLLYDGIWDNWPALWSWRFSSLFWRYLLDMSLLFLDIWEADCESETRFSLRTGIKKQLSMAA